MVAFEREAVPPKVKFQEVRLPNPASRWPVEVVSPQGWIVRLQNGSDVQFAPIVACAAMLSVSGATRVLVATTPVDLRGSFNRLYSLVVEQLKGDPLSGHLFVFTNG